MSDLITLLEEQIDFKTLRIFDNEGQIVEGLESIKFIDYDSDPITPIQIGGGKKFWYRFKEDVFGNEENDLEFHFGDTAPIGDNWNEDNRGTIEIGDGYYKIAYNLVDQPIKRIKIIINDIEEQEYAQDILIDFEETNTILLRSREVSNRLILDPENHNINVNLLNGNGFSQIPFKQITDLPKRFIYSPEVFSLPINPKIVFIREFTSYPDIYLTNDLVNRKRERYKVLDEALTSLGNIEVSLSNLDDSAWGIGTSIQGASVDTIENSRYIKITNRSGSNLTFSPNKIYKVNGYKITIDETQSKTIPDGESLSIKIAENMLVSISNGSIVEIEGNINGIYTSINKLILDKIIGNFSDIEKPTIAESILACRDIAITIHKEKKIIKDELKNSSELLQKLLINKISELNNIIELQINPIFPSENYYRINDNKGKKVNIVAWDVIIYLMTEDYNNTFIPTENPYNYIKHFEEGSNSANIRSRKIIRVLDKNLERDQEIRLNDGMYNLLNGTSGTDFIIIIKDENNLLTEEDTFQKCTTENYGSVLIIDEELYSIKNIDLENEIKKIYLDRNLKVTITSDTIIKKINRFPIFKLFSFREHVSIPICFNDKYMIFVRTVNEFNECSAWSLPVYVDCKLTQLIYNQQTEKYKTLNEFVNSFIVEEEAPIILPISKVPLKFEAPSRFTYTIFDSMQGDPNLGDSLTTIEQHRTNLDNLLKEKDRIETEMLRRKLEFLTAKNENESKDKYRSLLNIVYKDRNISETEGDYNTSLEEILENILNYEYLVNYVDNPLYNRYNALITITNDPAVIKLNDDDKIPSENIAQIKKYKLKYFLMKKVNDTYVKIDSSEKIIDGPEVLTTNYNPYTEEYTYEKDGELTPLYARQFKIPILPNERYGFQICAISTHNIASDWSDYSDPLTSQIYFAIETTQPISIISKFIDARIALKTIKLDRSIEDMTKQINMIQELLANQLIKDPVIGDLIATYTNDVEGGNETDGFWEFLINYEATALITGFAIKVYYVHSGKLMYWKTLAIMTTVEFNNLKSSLRWVVEDSDLEEFIIEKFGKNATPEELGEFARWETEKVDCKNRMCNSYLQFRLELYNETQYKLVKEGMNNEQISVIPEEGDIFEDEEE